MHQDGVFYHARFVDLNLYILNETGIFVRNNNDDNNNSIIYYLYAGTIVIRPTKKTAHEHKENTQKTNNTEKSRKNVIKNYILRITDKATLQLLKENL